MKALTSQADKARKAITDQAAAALDVGMSVVSKTKDVANTGFQQIAKGVGGIGEVGAKAVPIKTLDTPILALRKYMNSAASGTAAWARLGGKNDNGIEKRPPFEYCILLKVPTASVIGAMMGAAAKSASAAAGAMKRQSARLSNKVVPTSQAATKEESGPTQGGDKKAPETKAPETPGSDSNPLPPVHAVIVDDLHKKGLQIMVVRDVYHHGSQYTMLLLNASDEVINEQIFRIKLLRWMRKGGIGDMPDRDALAVTSPAIRIMAIQHIMDHLVYTDEQNKQHEFVADGGNVVADFFPLHDKAANSYLLNSVFNRDSNIIDKVKSTFLSDGTLDAIRNHFGDRTGFYYAYMSHYTKWLYYLCPIGILALILNGAVAEEHANKILATYSVLLVTWGTLMVAFWRQRSKELKNRWGLEDLDGHEKRLRDFVPEKDRNGVLTKDRDYYPMWKRYAVIPTMIPFFIVLFCVLYSVVLALFWFEMWVVFDWGDCTSVNEELIAADEFPSCRSSATTKGISGTLLEITPGLMEAIFFEILLAIFTLVSTLVCKLQNWRTEEEKDQAFAKQIFAMEFFGVFCWYFILSFLFVPILFVNAEEEDKYPWDKPPSFSNSTDPHWYMRCRNDHDSTLFDHGSFSCIKEQCPYMLRVKMMKAYMLTPFVVNQLINMVIKTGLPKWIHTNLKEEKGNRKGCYLGLCQLLGLILGHGGMRFKSEKCPTLKVELYKMEGWENDNTGGLAAHEHELEVEEIAEMHDEMHDDADHTGLHADREHEKFEKHKRKLKREATKKKIQDRRNRGDPLAHFKEAEVNVEFIMEESILWDFNEFNEQLEICLQFGWIMLFSAVFPLGSTIAMINNTLEMRSDTYKLTNVCKRPVPAVSNGIGAWESILEGIIKAAVVVNVAIMAISLNAFNLWTEPKASSDYEEGEFRMGAFDNWREIALLIFIVITVFEWLLKLVTSLVPELPASMVKMKKDRKVDLFRLFANPEDLEERS